MKPYEICALEKCPICDSELMLLLDFFGNELKCRNGCLYVCYDDNITSYPVNTGMVKRCRVYTLRIFNETLLRRVVDGDWRYLDFNDRIEYWKEDYRYLAEILERN